jgi:hydroxyversicolorone monooxygenase
MTFNTEIVGAYWQQETGEWLVKMKQTQSDGQTKLFDERCHMLLYGTGILNNFKWPNIEGMEKFKGKVFIYVTLPLVLLTGPDHAHGKMAQGLPS